MSRTILTVEHYLRIYSLRSEMQEEGTTNPSQEIKDFTKDIVQKLSVLNPEEEVILRDRKFFDTKGNLIASIPKSEDLD